MSEDAYEYAKTLITIAEKLARHNMADALRVLGFEDDSYHPNWFTKDENGFFYSVWIDSDPEAYVIGPEAYNPDPYGDADRWKYEPPQTRVKLSAPWAFAGQTV